MNPSGSGSKPPIAKQDDAESSDSENNQIVKRTVDELTTDVIYKVIRDKSTPEDIKVLLKEAAVKLIQYADYGRTMWLHVHGEKYTYKLEAGEGIFVLVALRDSSGNNKLKWQKRTKKAIVKHTWAKNIWGLAESYVKKKA